MMADVGDALEHELRDLSGLDGASLRRQRQEKFMAIGRTGVS